jgi:septal ring factor EnvC (AmiA/AmiB activator)
MRRFVEKHLTWIISAVAALVLFAASAVAAKAVEPVATRVTSLEAQYESIRRSLEDIKQEQKEQREDIKKLLERR